MTNRDPSIAEELTGWGKVAEIETVGRTSGRAARAAVGFVADGDGSLLVAAGKQATDWALNLQANPSCQVRIGNSVTRCHAALVDDEVRGRALAQLILKYGTPAEKLGHGPVFRLIAQK